MSSKSSYRPHNPGHDHYAPGVYLITLVVRNRERNHELLDRLNGEPAETDYSIFHNLNHLVEEICSFDGDARVIYNEK